MTHEWVLISKVLCSTGSAWEIVPQRCRLYVDGTWPVRELRREQCVRLAVKSLSVKFGVRNIVKASCAQGPKGSTPGEECSLQACCGCLTTRRWHSRHRCVSTFSSCVLVLIGMILCADAVFVSQHYSCSRSPGFWICTDGARDGAEMRQTWAWQHARWDFIQTFGTEMVGDSAA